MTKEVSRCPCGNPALFSRRYCSAQCRKKYQDAQKKAYRKSDKFKAYQKAYQKSDKFKAYQKAYQKSDKFKAYQKAYYLRNKETCLE